MTLTNQELRGLLAMVMFFVAGFMAGFAFYLENKSNIKKNRDKNVGFR